MILTTVKECRGSRQLYRLDNDELQVEPWFTSIVVKNLASGVSLSNYLYLRVGIIVHHHDLYISPVMLLI